MHKIITGMAMPSAGVVSIFGHDTRTEHGRSQIRSIMGVCPQHDVLYDNMSVREHLELYGTIKGVAPDRLTTMIEEGMAEVHLDSQSEVASMNLSGGQKRKLSVAIALIGDPKVVCVDEPTSGMDPFSRRQLWDLLQSKRNGRIILLTTHFMDEADILADRKAILSEGRLQCLGSSLFLKARYGVGYHLNIVSTAERDIITGLVETEIGLKVAVAELGGAAANAADASGGGSESVEREYTYELPLSSVQNFAKLFLKIDQSRASLGISNYGIAMTTLEEVFLKLAALTNDDAAETSSQGDDATGSQLHRQPPPQQISTGSLGDLSPSRPISISNMAFDSTVADGKNAVIHGAQKVSLVLNGVSGDSEIDDEQFRARHASIPVWSSDNALAEARERALKKRAKQRPGLVLASVQMDDVFDATSEPLQRLPLPLPYSYSAPRGSVGRMYAKCYACRRLF